MTVKHILLLFLNVFLFYACSSTNNDTIVNRKYTDFDNKSALIGKVDKSAFNDPDFNEWYSKEYKAYTPNKDTIRKLVTRKHLYRVEIFFGTWDTISQVQLPRFIKILDKIRFDSKKLRLYALNRRKESFSSEETLKNIINVPTFIIYKENKEVGRIIEGPKGEGSLEGDLYKIMKRRYY